MTSWINVELPSLLFFRKIRLEVNNFEEKRTVENVIGYIKGQTEPGELTFRKFLKLSLFLKLTCNKLYIKRYSREPRLCYREYLSS